MRHYILERALWGMLLVMGGLLVAGCYTVLVHPQVDMTAEDNSPRMCSDCHSSADYYYWHYPYQYNWYSNNRYWNGYYNNPWWWDNYWYWHDDDHDGGETPRAPGAHLWQPRVPPTEGSEPVISPGTSGNTKGGGQSSGQGGDQGGKTKGESDNGHLFQPRVPPKDSGSSTSQDTGKSDAGKPDDSGDKKAEDKK